MNKFFLLIFFSINLPDLFMARLIPENENPAGNECQITDKTSKTISVVSYSRAPDKCRLFISNSTEIHHFNIEIEIKNNTNTCETGIEYINSQNPRIVSMKDKRSLNCPFKVYLNVMEKLEKKRNVKYFDRYWMIVSYYSNGHSFDRVFFMNNATWWKDHNYNSVELRPFLRTSNKFSENPDLCRPDYIQ